MFVQAFIQLLTCAVLCVAPQEHADNLVDNPGFETTSSGAAAPWHVFAAPQDGAAGRIVGAARTGQWAALLHNPMPYAREPFNNWSQQISNPPVNTSLTLSGFIKTEEATEAMLWAQCWRGRPLRLLETASTASAAPLSGTRDWQAVEIAFQAPRETDFIVVRCVLRGVGAAWFDDIALRATAKPEDPPDAKSNGAAPPAVEAAVPHNDHNAVNDKPPAPPSVNASEHRLSMTSPAALSNEAETPRDKETLSESDAATTLNSLEQDVQRMRETNLLLMEALERMELRNEELMDEVLSLRENVRRVQETTQSTATQSAQTATPPSAPPLVPHGADWQTTLENKEP